MQYVEIQLFKDNILQALKVRLSVGNIQLKTKITLPSQRQGDFCLADCAALIIDYAANADSIISFHSLYHVHTADLTTHNAVDQQRKYH